MPASIKGKKLTAKQHEQWKKTFEATGSGAIATAAVKKSMAKKSSKKGKKTAKKKAKK